MADGAAQWWLLQISAFLQHLVSRVSTVWASQWIIFNGWQASHSYNGLFQYSYHIKIGNVQIGNVQIGNVQIGNVQIGNVQIGNNKIRNVEIGRMEWPFSATVETTSLHTAIKWEARLVTTVGRFWKWSKWCSYLNLPHPNGAKSSAKGLVRTPL